MNWFQLGWWYFDTYVQQHQLSVTAVLAHNISETMTRLEQYITTYKSLHASASQEFHRTLRDNLRAVDAIHVRLYNCCCLFSKTLKLPMNEFHVNIAHVLFTGYSVFMLASCGESVYRAASRVRLSLAHLYNVLCRECQEIPKEDVLMARNVLRAMKRRQPHLTVGGLFEMRMSLVTGFVSLTATYLITILQFNNVL
ncbi:hypothetical protein EVAR_62406_1 [Eumeta japonica]|uniref:Gustatory receptor n=1 Tax=Eumeta variegata TaxID=151549 RepID=A0A4C1ZA24_EUMVA|nr:hypothetical protein EVAR_62406_1 [Eumeta japonica]